MDYNARRRTIRGAVYIILALLAAAVMFTAVFTISKDNKKLTKPPAVTTARARSTAAETSTAPAAIPHTEKKPEIPEETTVFETQPPAATSAKTRTAPAATAPATSAAAAKPEEAAEVINIIPERAPTEFELPAKGSVSKDYTSDTLVYSLTMNDYRVHLGVDVATLVGAPVCACADGVVGKIYVDPFMGSCIMVDHGGGLRSFYMNLSETHAKGIAEGASVARGQTISGVGESSMTELADGSHLHFEMTLAGRHVDPMDYIPYSETVFYED